MLARVKEGVEVIVEQDDHPVAVIKTPQRPGRKISECLALAKAYEEKLMAMAQLAAKIDAAARQLGLTIPLTDLLIGSTGLHFGYAAGTRNMRHFQMVPDLDVIQF